MGKTFSFVSGALFGAAAGAIIGVALAPRSGAETRAMAADIANDAWDNMRDTYEHSAEEARAAVNDFGPMVDAKTDDLRAKVDLARERMDQLREQLNDAISGGNVTPAADVVVENAVEADAEAAEPQGVPSFDDEPQMPIDTEGAVVENHEAPAAVFGGAATAPSGSAHEGNLPLVDGAGENPAATVAMPAMPQE